MLNIHHLPIKPLLALAVCACIATNSHAADPEAKLIELLTTLKSGKIDGAMTAFLGNGLVAKQKPAEIRAMDGQAKAAFEFYGPPTSWEVLERRAVGTDLVNVKLISKHSDDAPMFWNAIFYRRNAQWEPLGVQFFDDPRRAGIF